MNGMHGSPGTMAASGSSGPEIEMTDAPTCDGDVVMLDAPGADGLEVVYDIEQLAASLEALSLAEADDQEIVALTAAVQALKITNDMVQSSQSFPPAAAPQSNTFSGFAPAPPSGGFNFSTSVGPAANPFQSQNPAGGSNNFSSSFTFGSSNSAPQSNAFASNNANGSAASNPFANITQSAPPNNLFGNTTSTSAPSTNIFGTSSSAPSNNLFGATNASTAPSSNLFGTSSAQPNAFANNQPSSTTNAFSASSSTFGTTSSAAPASNIFAPTTSSAPTNNIFGASTSSATPTNVFGAKTSSTPSTNLFATSTPATSSAPSQPSTNLFGASTTATSSAPSQPAANLFGTSTTTATSQPSTNLFGASTTATSSAPSQSSTNLFAAASSSAPSNNIFGGTASFTAPSSTPSTNIFASSSPAPGSSAPAQPANMFAQSTSGSTPPSNLFGFGTQKPAESTDTENDTSKTGTTEPKTSNNIFSQSTSGFKPPSTNMFDFSAQSPSKPAAEEAVAAKPSTNLFSQSTSTGAPQMGSNLFGFNSPSASKTTVESKSQDDAQQTAESQSSTANLFAKAASSTTSQSSGFNMFGQQPQSTATKGNGPAASPVKSNPFASIAASSASSSATAGAPTLNISSTAAQGSSNAIASVPAENFDMASVDLQKIREARRVHIQNIWYKQRVGETPANDDAKLVAIAQVFSEQGASPSGTPSSGAESQSSSKSNGKRKADNESEPSDVNRGGSPKKAKPASGQTDSAAGASKTANIFSSIVNKPAQSPLRNVESAAPEAEAGPSNNNIFGASSSSPFKFGASGGISGSTTPAGSPAKPNAFSTQPPLKAPSFGQTSTQSPKRKSDDISSDDKEEESQDDTAQQEKRQRTSTPFSSADTGSVLNSRQPSPDANNIFGHLSQDEADKDDDSDDNGEPGSTTPPLEPMRTDGLFGRITKDDTDPSTPEQSGGLFGRITKDDAGNTAVGTISESAKAATANPFGFSSTSYDVPGGAKTGPVLKTWNGDAGSPIKFGSSQPASSENANSSEAKKDAPASNPFAQIASSSSSGPIFKFTPAATPPPASDSSPFKFNPAPATPAGTGSVFASTFGSRATTPGLSTGASENDTSAAENEDEEEAPPVDKEQISLRTALTEEDKKTYDVLYDTDSKIVTMVHLVDRTEEEVKADPKKPPKKWELSDKGPLRVLKHKETGGVSILLKSEPLGRAVINTRVQSKFSYKRAKVKFAAFPLPDDKGKITTQYLKFDDDGDCTKFVEVCESNKS